MLSQVGVGGNGRFTSRALCGLKEGILISSQVFLLFNGAGLTCSVPWFMILSADKYVANLLVVLQFVVRFSARSRRLDIVSVIFGFDPGSSERARVSSDSSAFPLSAISL